MIDVHCHLEHMEEPEQVIIEAEKRGMQKIITSIPDPADMSKIIHLKDKYPDFLKLCLGFHPNENANYSDTEITDYIDSIIRQNFGIVGIGEVGLEYPMSSDGQIVMPDALTKERMFSTFEKFIELANSMKLPIVIHIRNAYEDALEILERQSNTDVVLHCFSGSETDLKRALDMGYWISFATNVCYTKKHPRLAAKTPLDSMVLETDSPWLNPDNPKLRINRPWNIEKSAEVIAALHGCAKQDVLRKTTLNARRVFGLM